MATELTSAPPFFSISRAWTSISPRRATTGAELFSNLRALPGFGDQKAKIFTALLGKRVGVTPPGWEEAAGFYADRGCYSVADVDGPDSLARVREYKRAAKAEAKAKANPTARP